MFFKTKHVIKGYLIKAEMGKICLWKNQSGKKRQLKKTLMFIGFDGFSASTHCQHICQQHHHQNTHPIDSLVFDWG